MWGPVSGTHLDLLGSAGFRSLSDGGGGEKLGLDAWLELSGGCVGHLLLLLRRRRRRLSCLNRHLLGSDLKETPGLTCVLHVTFIQSPTASHLLLNGRLSLLRLSCLLLGGGRCRCCRRRLLVLLDLKQLLNLHLGEGRSQDRPTWNRRRGVNARVKLK